MYFFAGWCFGVISGITFIIACYCGYEKQAIKKGWINLAGKIYILTPAKIE